MTTDVATDLERERLLRRIDALRQRRVAQPDADHAAGTESRSVVDFRRRRAEVLATRLAAAVGGVVAEGPSGRHVRVDGGTSAIVVDRTALATLPGLPPADAPLVCLDTETTGLGTATGTLPFLVGLGWWDEDRFVQAQLLLPDHADERSLLAAVRAALPPGSWLVTYNGRGFDWPLLVTRWRLDRTEPPALDGHLDLLPLVRGLFRHRLSDARLRTVEHELLGIRRVDDVAGWEIPGRYLAFLRDADASPLRDVARHNHEDVRSLARLLASLATSVANREMRATCHPGDLAGLARLLTASGRLEEALECLEVARSRPAHRATVAREDAGGYGVRVARTGRIVAAPPLGSTVADRPWWSPSVPADIGGDPDRTVRSEAPEPPLGRRRFAQPWDPERIDRERARLLRRLGRVDEAVDVWRAIALRGGRRGAIAWVEVAKVEEHVRRDPRAALTAADRAMALATRLRAIGLPVRGLDADLHRRRARLRRRLERNHVLASRPWTSH